VLLIPWLVGEERREGGGAVSECSIVKREKTYSTTVRQFNKRGKKKRGGGGEREASFGV